MVSVFAYTVGRKRAERSVYDNQVVQGTSVRLSGDIIGTLGGERIFYSTYCGSSCLGFTMHNLTTGQVRKGSLGFMYTNNGYTYTLFDDGNGKAHRFDGEFVSVNGREYGEKLILDFVTKDERTSKPAVYSVEFDEL